MTKVIQFPSSDGSPVEARRRRAPFQDFVRSVLKHVQLPENPRVLICGREVADAARVLTEHLQGRGEFLALHPNLESAPGLRYPVEWRNWSPEQLPLRGGEFDLAFGARALMHLEHPPQIVREMVRILKPNAQLLLIEADLGGYIITMGEELEVNASVRLNPYIARELPALCREAGLALTDLFPNFVVGFEPLTRELWQRRNPPIRTLRPHLVSLDQLDVNEYVRGMERIVEHQTPGHMATLLDIAILARKLMLAPKSKA